MIVLAFNDNHDTSAALVADGELVAAVAQERMDRIKLSSAFPDAAIEEVLRLSGVAPGDVDKVVAGSHFTPTTALRGLPEFHQRAKGEGGQFSPLLNAYILYQSALRATGAWRAEAAASRRLLARRLESRGFDAPLTTVDHHAAHAATAGLSQDRDPVLVITIDAMGDGSSVTVSLQRRGRQRLLYRQSGLAAINTYYSRVTEHLGFRPLRHEGKITGLAAYAEPPPELVDHFACELVFQAPGFNLKNYASVQRDHGAFYRTLDRYSREEVAAALQANLEIQVCRFVRHWVRRTGVADLAVAGGLFANVKLNQRIHEMGHVDSLFVYPHMGDGGLAVGAALLGAGAPPRALDHVFLGSRFSDADCEAALQQHGLAYERPPDLAQAVARRLAAGKVVARFDGAMEWGPRALGNRSILVKPDDPSVNRWLNGRLGRTEFMPFAPVTPMELAEQCYRGTAGARGAARFMTVCFDCTDEMRRRCPGVVHLDGTARPQLVRRKENSGLWEIVKAFREITGLPALINTSFNMHEEPIVRTPGDAAKAFVDGSLEHLVAGPFLASRPTTQSVEPGPDS